MLTQGFYYFLVVGELAILGLIIAGIYLKVQRIISMTAGGGNDKNSEHYVSKSDHNAGARDVNFISRSPALPGLSEKIRPEDSHLSTHS